MSAGQDLEPYWEVYRQHFRGHVLEWIETHRIGTLSPDDAKRSREETSVGDMCELSMSLGCIHGRCWR